MSTQAQLAVGRCGADRNGEQCRTMLVQVVYAGGQFWIRRRSSPEDAGRPLKTEWSLPVPESELRSEQHRAAMEATYGAEHALDEAAECPDCRTTRFFRTTDLLKAAKTTKANRSGTPFDVVGQGG